MTGRLDWRDACRKLSGFADGEALWTKNENETSSQEGFAESRAGGCCRVCVQFERATASWSRGWRTSQVVSKARRFAC
jgi:hypothetical protein